MAKNKILYCGFIKIMNEMDSLITTWPLHGKQVRRVRASGLESGGRGAAGDTDGAELPAPEDQERAKHHVRPSFRSQ